MLAYHLRLHFIVLIFGFTGILGKLIELPSMSIVLYRIIIAIAALSLSGAVIASAEPLNCTNGQFWDPITNTCQTPQPAQDCAPGQYWNALSNACRPLGQLWS